MGNLVVGLFGVVIGGSILAYRRISGAFGFWSARQAATPWHPQKAGH